MKVEKKVLGAYATMLKVLSNEVRLNILYSLFQGPKTWTELILELKINPKSLRDHLNFLKKSKLVRKRKPVGFEITTAGKAFVELSLRDIISVVEKATKIAEETN